MYVITEGCIKAFGGEKRQKPNIFLLTQFCYTLINVLKPTGYVMHHRCNIQ